MDATSMLSGILFIYLVAVLISFMAAFRPHLSSREHKLVEHLALENHDNLEDTDRAGESAICDPSQ